MNTRRWQSMVVRLPLLAALSFPAWAASVGHRAGQAAREGHRPESFFRKLERLGLTPEQREAIQGLLAQQREALQTLRAETAPKYQSVRQETDAKIRALLNPEQQKKFDALLASQQEARAARRQGS